MVMTIATDDEKKFRILGNGSGIRSIIDDYDVFLLDMWGVMHDGNQPYSGVQEVVKKLKSYNSNINDNNNDNVGGQKKKEKKLIILSNSSKRKIDSVKMLQQLGFNENDFDEIITSGEVAHHLLQYLSSKIPSLLPLPLPLPSSSWVPKNVPNIFQDLRSRNGNDNNKETYKAFCFGSGDEDEIYLNSCGWTLETNNIKNANLIVCRGPFVIHQKQQNDDCNSHDDNINNNFVDKRIDEKLYWSTYHDVLDQAARLRIPMIVCNPDKIRPDANKSPMPGTIGVAYEELLSKYHGGNNSNNNENNDLFDDSLVLYLGKPFPSVYEIALSSLTTSSDDSDDDDDDDDDGTNTNINKSRVAMVGDALETDITGASMAGIDSIWVIKDGIHNQDVIAAATICNGYNDTGASSTNPSLSSILESECETVLQDFNQNSETTYAKGRQVSPTFVIPHFRW